MLNRLIEQLYDHEVLEHQCSIRCGRSSKGMVFVARLLQVNGLAHHQHISMAFADYIEDFDSQQLSAFHGCVVLA